MKNWVICVFRTAGWKTIGVVRAESKDLAESLALSRYGLAKDQVAAGAEPTGPNIFPGERIYVSPEPFSQKLSFTDWLLTPAACNLGGMTPRGAAELAWRWSAVGMIGVQDAWESMGGDPAVITNKHELISALFQIAEAAGGDRAERVKSLPSLAARFIKFDYIERCSARLRENAGLSPEAADAAAETSFLSRTPGSVPEVDADAWMTDSQTV